MTNTIDLPPPALEGCHRLRLQELLEQRGAELAGLAALRRRHIDLANDLATQSIDFNLRADEDKARATAFRVRGEAFLSSGRLSEAKQPGRR